MTTKNYEMGFFGRRFMGEDARMNFCGEWSKMTDSEKPEFMNKRMEHFGEGHSEDRFSVEAIDNRCEKRMKMTQGEKEAFVDERKKSFAEKMSCTEGFFGYGRFGRGEGAFM
jgi:hypothetical protein